MKAEMLALLSAPAPDTRAEALRWLAANGDTDDAAAVARLVGDAGEFDDRDRADDPPEAGRTPVRMVALETLLHLRDPETFAGLFDHALQDTDLRVRASAALGATTPALLARLAVEGDRGVRYRIASELLGHDTGHGEAVSALQHLRSGDDLPAIAARAVLAALNR